MNIVLAVAVGGGLGAVARYYFSSLFPSANFPWGILATNVLGGLAMGVIVELGALKLNYSPELRAFMTTGILGGFTTFSAFSLDTVLLMQRGNWMGATLYIAASVLLSVWALMGAMWIVRTVV